MLRWTASGAVRLPTTVQVRCRVAAPTGLDVRADAPSRALRADEIDENLRWFVARIDPRRPRCDGLVLSHPQADAATASAVVAARQQGLRQVVVHTTPDDLHAAVALGADALAVAIVDRVPLWPSTPATAVVSLGLLDAVADLADALVRRPPSRVVFAWPAPAPDRPPPPAWDVVGATLVAVGARLDAAGLRWGVKGLPACALRDAGVPSAASRAWRTRNRYLVDADHQGAAARLWMPDVVVLSRPETCRRCRVAFACDGVARPWLDARLAGALRPFGEERAAA